MSERRRLFDERTSEYATLWKSMSIKDLVSKMCSYHQVGSRTREATLTR